MIVICLRPAISRCPLWVKSGNAHNEPMMSAFHSIATEQRTRFYVGSVPFADSNDVRKLVLHSITSSARARMLSGIVSPRALAVLMLIASSNLVGC
jgi:hypothetical protein